VEGGPPISCDCKCPNGRPLKRRSVGNTVLIGIPRAICAEVELGGQRNPVQTPEGRRKTRQEEEERRGEGGTREGKETDFDVISLNSNQLIR
jgi:hypothetical protein